MHFWEDGQDRRRYDDETDIEKDKIEKDDDDLKTDGGWDVRAGVAVLGKGKHLDRKGRIVYECRGRDGQRSRGRRCIRTALTRRIWSRGDGACRDVFAADKFIPKERKMMYESTGAVTVSRLGDLPMGRRTARETDRIDDDMMMRRT